MRLLSRALPEPDRRQVPAMVELPFHPAVSRWFERTFRAPTEPQARGWPAIQAGRHTLIAAPTGSGKTLAAFLAAIDDLVREGLAGRLTDATQVLYVSPLKALSNDVEKNLQAPLQGIRATLAELGLPDVALRAQVRTGDTPAAERTATLRRPPHLFVTTPESLYILLTSAKARGVLRTVRTVIVDEIHALVDDKRGSHLALSLERLEALTERPPVRIGLSATQQPIAEVARFLVGSRRAAPDGTPDCTIVDMGHARRMALALELPASPLEAVISGEVWEEVFERLCRLIEGRRTTLVFVNTRNLAERVAHQLSQRLGAEHVTCHHGSLSREKRLDAEQRLKAGTLRALVATASLELGIDIGQVDLVCQLGSPRWISTLLQRVGRSGHHLGGLPEGRLFPLSRDELVECAALVAAARRGLLDRLTIPVAPLDILAQQIVAAVAGDEWSEEELYGLVRRAYPYRDLARDDFEAVLRMLAEGYTTRRGRRGAWLHRDAVNGRLRPRKGARLAAITSGGAIPETADYRVVQEPSELFVGTVNEDFAIESNQGDIFQLGNTSWRILQVSKGQVRVADAHGQPPSIPFWLGEAPGRSDELSAEVSRLRTAIAERLGERPGGPAHLAHAAPDDSPAPNESPPRPSPVPFEVGDAGEAPARDGGAPEPVALPTQARIDAATRWAEAELGLGQAAAAQLVGYLALGQAALGAMPTQETLVLERFFDESGGMQLVVHSPFGGRLNRAWGLALRKRFCRQFNFELQAAANENAIVISLGQTHSFPLDSVYRFLNARTVRDVLIQALLAAPMFGARWRWNVTRALAVLRFSGGRKVAPPLQRMQADDLLALVFPDSQACLENIVGDREIPDHPLVRQTLRDCLEEAMDIAGLERLLRAIERGEKRLVARDLREPSPLAAEILTAKPYAFLDDAPLEERRTQAVIGRRWLDVESAADLGALDAAAILRVREEAWPEVGSPDELHDALMLLGTLTEGEVASGAPDLDATGPGPGFGTVAPPPPATQLALLPAEPTQAEGAPAAGDPEPPEGFPAGRGWAAPMAALVAERRAACLCTPGGTALWVAAERLPQLRLIHPAAVLEPPIDPPTRGALAADSPERALVEVLRGRLEGLGPVTAAALAAGIGLPEAAVMAALAALEAEGFVLRGRYTARAPAVEWCERRLLARIHRYTLNRLRQEIEPVTSAELMRFLCAWQRVDAEHRGEGQASLAAALDQLEEFEAAAAAWEGEILPARVVDYAPAWLDALCLSGRLVWGRFTMPGTPGHGGRLWGPVRGTPIALCSRRRLAPWQARLGSVPVALPVSGDARAVWERLAIHGASFFAELMEATGLLQSQLEQALGELVAWGLVTADSFAGLRALLVPSAKRPPLAGHGRGTGSSLFGMESAGRWSRLRLGSLTVPPTAPPTLPAGSPAVEPARAPAPPPSDPEPRWEEAEVEWVARGLLRRYGVVFRRLMEREGLAPPWRELLRVYRRMEARGELRGGRFVAGHAGEQYALPEAVGLLRGLRKKPAAGELVALSAADPLNLLGIVLPGPRLASVPSNRIVLRDGLPVAVRDGGHIRHLTELPRDVAWRVEQLLLRHREPPHLRRLLRRRR